ncbi:hypothetical protein Tco_0827044, partial [Tanacetum coccineum]
GLESVSIRRIQGLGYGVLGFLKARIHHIFLDRYGVLVVRTVAIQKCSLDIHLVDDHVLAGGICNEDSDSLYPCNRCK